MSEVSRERARYNANSSIGFDDPNVGIEAEDIRARHDKSVAAINEVKDARESEGEELTRLRDAAQVLSAAGVEVDFNKISEKQKAFNNPDLSEVESLDRDRKAALWDAQEHYRDHEEEYRIAAVNETALKGIEINTSVNGKRVMPVEAAIKDATSKGKTINYAGESYEPPIVWR